MKRLAFFVMMLLASYGLTAQAGNPVWFELGNFNPNPTIQTLDDVENLVPDLDLRITKETNNNLCKQWNCRGTNTGFLLLSQKNATDDIRITANVMQQYVIELRVVDQNEIISIFTESQASQGVNTFELVSGIESVTQQSAGLPATIGYPSYNGRQGISVRGRGYGSNSATVTIVAEPATDLIIRYQGIGSSTKYGSFRIGRLEPEIDKIESFLLTDAANAPNNAAQRFSDQGLAIDHSTNEVFTSSYYNSSYYVARFQIENNGSWTYLEQSDVLSTINATNIYAGTPPAGKPPYDHIGAIDYHDGYLWVGLYGDGSVWDAVAKVRVNNFNPNNNPPPFVVENVYYTNEVDDIDATAFDGTHLWVSAYQGIYRFAVSDFGTHTLNNGKRLNAHPRRLGGDFDNAGSYTPDPDFYLFSQGLRVISGSGSTPDRLLAIFPNFNKCSKYPNTEFCANGGTGFLPAPFTGLYEFDISGDIEEEKTPTRIWYIPHDKGGRSPMQHLEGFEFVPGQPNRIYLTDSGGKQIDVFEIQQLQHNNDFLINFNNTNTAHNSGDMTMLKTTATTISDEVALRNYPNPFTDMTTIEYVLPQDGKVSMTISDLSGKALANPLQDKMCESGVHTLQFDATSLSAGMYFCTLQTANIVKTHKITVFE